MVKHIFILLLIVHFIKNAEGQFVVNDVLAVDPQSSIFDPEYNPTLHLVCWKSENNDLWISGLDHQTRLFEPLNGHGTFVTGNLAPNGNESWNGPEWMLSEQGTQIVYIKGIWGERYPGIATKVFGGWMTMALMQYPGVVYAMATANYADSVARLLFETHDNDGIYWLKNTDLWTRYYYPEVTLGFFARDNQQICCATNKARHPGFIETSCTLPYFTRISDDTIGAPFMWHDPETDRRLFMYRTNEFKTLKIMEEILPDFWVLYKQFNSPLPDPFCYITSPEPFVCGGKSYISFMAAQASSGKEGKPAQIWIASANPEDPLMRRVSDSIISVRTDPEPVVFSDSAFIYYTDVVTNKNQTMNYHVRKCDTGLGNLYTATPPDKEAVTDIMVYPNPSDGRFNVKIASLPDRAARIKIINTAGQEVYSTEVKGTLSALDLSALPNGLYTLIYQQNSRESITNISIVR